MCVFCRNGMSMSGAICAGCKCKSATCNGRAVPGKSTTHPARQARHLSLGTCHSALGTGYTDTAHGTLAEPQQTMAEASASYMMHRAWGVGVGVGVGVDVSVGPAGRCLGLVECRPSLELGLGLAWLWLGNTTAPICVLAITIPYIICKPGCAGTVRGSCRCFIISPTV